MDTSAFFAAANESDRDNARAVEVLSNDHPLVTSDHVLVETWNLIMRHLSRDAAELVWQEVRGGVALIENAGPGDLEVAWEIGRDFADQSFSIVDRTSFAMMERLGIHRVATFDDDFAIYRFGPKRDRAFEIVR